MSQEFTDIVKKVDAAFADNKMEDFYALCADDIEWTMAGEGTQKGKDSIREWMKAATEDCGPSFPSISPTRMIVDADSVASYGTMSMKDEDGNDAGFEYCDIYEFRGGLIAKLTSFVVKAKADGEK